MFKNLFVFYGNDCKILNYEKLYFILGGMKFLVERMIGIDWRYLNSDWNVFIYFGRRVLINFGDFFYFVLEISCWKL